MKYLISGVNPSIYEGMKIEIDKRFDHHRSKSRILRFRLFLKYHFEEIPAFPPGKIHKVSAMETSI